MTDRIILPNILEHFRPNIAVNNPAVQADQRPHAIPGGDERVTCAARAEGPAASD